MRISFKPARGRRRARVERDNVLISVAAVAFLALVLVSGILAS